MTRELTLYSDGGGVKDRVAGAACILEQGSGEIIKVCAFLGGATNNEAEIFGGLLGFSLIRALELSGAAKSTGVRWISDSEYVLKSATGYIFAWQKNGWRTAAKKPVKNQGLWRAYLELARDVKISPQHVAGHSGHPENEACDRASTWVQFHGEEVLAEHGAGARIDIDDPQYGSDWVVIDGRDFLLKVRTEEPEGEDLIAIERNLVELGINSFDPKSLRSVEASRGGGKVSGKAIRDSLTGLKNAARTALSENSEEGKALAGDIEALIKKYTKK